MIAIDSASRIVAWNAAAESLFGRAAGAVLGQCCADVLGWRDRHGNLVCNRKCEVGRRAARLLPSGTQRVLATSGSGRDLWVTVSTLVLPRVHHRYCRLVHFVREVAFTPLEEAARQPANADPGPHELVRSLTTREHDVLDLLSTGAATKVIASRMGISEITVDNHVAHILAKLKVHTRLEAVVMALRARGVRPDA